MRAQIQQRSATWQSDTCTAHTRPPPTQVTCNGQYAGIRLILPNQSGVRVPSTRLTRHVQASECGYALQRSWWRQLFKLSQLSLVTEEGHRERPGGRKALKPPSAQRILWIRLVAAGNLTVHSVDCAGLRQRCELTSFLESLRRPALDPQRPDQKLPEAQW